ncbi:hypothetical protein K8R20_02745 [bacterium]|nr:hypothetical protein [bacterium]
MKESQFIIIKQVVISTDMREIFETVILKRKKKIEMNNIVSNADDKKVSESGIQNLIFLVRKYVVMFDSKKIDSNAPPIIVHSYVVHPLKIFKKIFIS